MSRIADASSSQGVQEQGQSPSRQYSKVVQRLMDATADLPQFLHDLLQTQAVMVAGTEAAAFLLERQGEEAGLRPLAHIRPDESDTDTRARAIRAFQEIIVPCVQQGKDGAIEVGAPDDGETQYCLVTLLRGDGQIVAVTAVIARARDADRAKQRLQMMQLVAGYFDLYSLKHYVEQAQATAERHQHVLQYAGAVGTAEGFKSAAMGLCNELATRAGATRVSLGWVKGRRVKLQALSHTEKFDKKQELVVQIERAMEECFDQEETVKYDPDGEGSANVTRAASDLSRAQAGNIVMSVPLRWREEIVGVLTVEFASRTVVEASTETGIAVAAELLAPQLYDRYENDRVVFVKIWRSVQNLAKLGKSPKYWGVKLSILAAIAVIVFVATFSPMYRVRSAMVLSAVDKRQVCSPYDGTLVDVLVRPGVPVKAGQVLAKLKTTDLEVKLASAEATMRSKALAADKARKEGKIAEQKIAEAEADEAKAQAALIQYYIDQASLRSPIDGVLLRGDLVDRKGAPVKQGEAMFEVAQSDPANPEQIAPEVEIRVSERDIQEVMNVAFKREFDGELATTTLPEKSFRFKITRVVPNGEPAEGENVFKVYGKIENPEPWMKPGLAGEARVNVEPRTLWWWWTHRFFDWMRLKLWI